MDKMFFSISPAYKYRRCVESVPFSNIFQDVFQPPQSFFTFRVIRKRHVFPKSMMATTNLWKLIKNRSVEYTEMPLKGVLIDISGTLLVGNEAIPNSICALNR